VAYGGKRKNPGFWMWTRTRWLSDLPRDKEGNGIHHVHKYPFSCPDIVVKVFDGKVIPYPDQEFDTSLVILVLHHVPKPQESLKELIRTSNREIIICEDLLRSRNEMVTEAIKDSIVNLFLPIVRMQYRLEKDWEKMFTESGLKIQDKTYFDSKSIFYFKHVAWQLSIV
jgi:SAM-dependent methyltransferase